MVHRLDNAERGSEPRGAFMGTEKLEFSLRLRHDSQSLSTVTRQLGFAVGAGWNRGDRKKTLAGSPRSGKRDSSYRSYDLGDAKSKDMDHAISECLRKLEPVSSVIKSFVDSGGTASLAVGWFFDSTADGGRISLEILARLAQLGLTLDLYLYYAPKPGAVSAAAE